jgi:hypothetical protein
MKKLNLEQVARAIALAFVANKPVALWGPVGIGKSSIIAQVRDGLGWKLYDVRLSDKEPSDLGGVPVPHDGALRYLMPDLLPFDTDEKAIVLFDEYDRSELAVQNVTLQIMLDRSVNGHKLSPNARVVLAGNGTTDSGTTPLSKAAASRMIHLYVEAESDEALASYDGWAEKNGITPATRSFAKYRKDVWTNGREAEQQTVEELAVACPRTFDMADRILQAADAVDFETRDILPAIVAGCVGEAAAVELVAWHKLCKDCPTIEQIVAAPQHCKLPGDLGVYYALTMTLANHVKAKTTKPTVAEQFAAYGLRWPEEQAAYLFKKLADNQPRVVTCAAFVEWRKRQGQSK